MIEKKIVGKIWHVDDDSIWRGKVSRVLTGEGHDVLSTSTFFDAVLMIPERISDRDVAILDGDLGEGEGEELVELIRRSQLSLTIVGFSSRIIDGVDVMLRKPEYNYGKFIDTIKGLVNKRHTDA